MSSNRRKPYPQVAQARIKAAILLDRLQNHAVGKLEMTQTQIAAAKILLGKVVPDLKAIEHSGPGGSELRYTLYVPPKDG